MEHPSGRIWTPSRAHGAGTVLQHWANIVPHKTPFIDIVDTRRAYRCVERARSVKKGSAYRAPVGPAKFVSVKINSQSQRALLHMSYAAPLVLY